jgi:hypothetical protein
MKTRELTTYSLLRCLCGAAALLFLALSGVKAADYPTTILKDNPSAYYRFEETSGSIANDSSTNDISATIAENGEDTSPLLGLPGIDTNSFYFAGAGPGGSSDFGEVAIPNSAYIMPLATNGTSSGAFSAELWVQPTAQNSTYEVPLEVAAYPNGWNFYVTGADAGTSSFFKLNMPGGVLFQTVGGPIQFLSWYHLVFTYDGTNATVYVNGTNAFGPFAVGMVPAIGSGADVGSGQGVGWLPFIGGIDEVAFYDYVLSASQVTNHYAVGTNSFRPGNIAAGITTAPLDETNYSGLPVTFSVTPSGTPPFNYIWFSNSVVVGPDADSLSFTAQYPGNNGANIQVIVTNNYGSFTSAVVTLTVLTNVNIPAGPGSITRNVGSHAAFHVTADGAVPLTYQWSVSSDGGTTFTSILNATNESLWLTNVQLSQSGNLYDVLVSNPFTSSIQSASLSVQARTDPAVPLTGYGAIVVADNPVAYWRLDEASGTLAEDAVGTFDGTYTANSGAIGYGAATGIPHSTDPAVTLSGGATIQVPWAPELNPDTAWSVETWIQPSVVGDQYRVVLSSEYNSYPNPYNGWYLYEQQGSPSTLAFVPQPGNFFVSASTALVVSNWYHVVVTDDTTNFNLYVNGQLGSSYPVADVAFVPNGDGINGDGTAGLPSGPDSEYDGANFVIGQRDDLLFGTFLGTVDDTAIYQYALSAQQVSSHYADGALLTIAKSGAHATLTWPLGVLQSSTNVSGIYTDVPSATSPYSPVTSGQPAIFYRVYVP